MRFCSEEKMSAAQEWTVKTMARIKGKYVAMVEINFDFEEDENYLPFDEIKNNIETELTPILQEVIQEEVAPNDICTTEVRQQFVDCYRVEEC